MLQGKNINHSQPGSLWKRPIEAVPTVPPVKASDLVVYLVLQTNFITTQQFKVYETLEAYNQFVCGSVKDVCNYEVHVAESVILPLV